MSLRCVGPAHIESAPTTRLWGATTASVSFWLQWNPGPPGPSADALLVGKAGGDPVALWALAGAPGRLRARWRAHDGAAEVGRAADLEVTPGSPAHIALTYEPGLQRTYLNGVLVHTDDCPSPLGAPGDLGVAGAFRVGPDAGGLDVTFDEVTVWQGAALSPTDVTGLYDRRVHPEGVAAGNIVWQLSLDGASGPASAGDPGLDDLGPDRLSAVNISTPPPTWVAGVLARPPVVRGAGGSGPGVTAAHVGGSGATIAAVLGDGSGNPVGMTGYTLATAQDLIASAAAGSFRYSYGGQTTAPVPVGADAAALQAALAALSTVGLEPDNTPRLAVTGRSKYRVTARGSFAGAQLPLIGVDASAALATAPPTPLSAGASPRRDAFWNQAPGCVLTPPKQRVDSDRWQQGDGSAYTSTTATGDGSASLAWDFTGLAPGNYLFATSWRPDPAANTAAAFQVFDGQTYRDAFTVDQTATVAPDMRDGNGNSLQAVRAFYCGSGTLSVVLTDQLPPGAASAGVSAAFAALAPVDPAAPLIVDQDTAATPIGLTYAVGSIGQGWSPRYSGAYYRGNKALTQPAPAAEYSWRVAGLLPGSYALEASYDRTMGGATAAASYAVTDGAAPPVAHGLDQTAAYAATLGYTDPQPGSVGFGAVGTVQCLSGTLTVVLSAASGVAQADAIRLTLVAPAGTAAPAVGSSAYVSTGAPPSYSVDGGPPVTLGTPIWDYDAANNAPNGSDCTWLLPTAIPPGAAVTLNVPAGVVATTAGLVPAATVAAQNASGGTILPDPPAARTLKSGHNGSPAYADAMKNSGPWQTSSDPYQLYTLDNNGWPTAPTGQIYTFVPVARSGSSLGPGQTPDPANPQPKGLPSAPSGHGPEGSTWTLKYRCNVPGWSCGFSGVGPDDVTAYAAGTTVAGDTAGQVDWVVTASYAVKDLAKAYGPDVSVFITGPQSAVAGITDARVYAPGVPTDGSKKYTDAGLAMIKGAGVLRAMGPLQANGSPHAEYAHYPTRSQRSYAAADQLGIRLKVKSIGATTYSDPTKFFLDNQTPVVVETTTPHGLTQTGQMVAFGTVDDIHYVGGGSTNCSGATVPAYVDLNDPQLGPNRFAFASGGATTPKSPVATPVGAGSTLTWGTYSVPPIDFFEACTLADHGGKTCDVWLNLGQAVSDDCVRKVIADYLAVVPAGSRKLYFELGNEHWNFSPGFPQGGYYQGLTHQMNGGNGSTPGYVVRQAHVHAVAAAALGSRSGELVRLFASQAPVSAITSQIASTALALGVPVDALAVAPYYNNRPQNSGAPGQGPLAATLTADQVADLMDLNLLYYSPASSLPSHLAAFAAAAPGMPTPELTVYECGLQNGSVGGLTDRTRANQSQALSQHPRMLAGHLYELGRLQTYGATHVNYYLIGSGYVDNGQGPYCGVYAENQGWNTAPGRNDGTDPGGYDVRPDLRGVGDAMGSADLSRAASVPGLAMTGWNSGLGAPKPVAPHRPLLKLPPPRRSGRSKRTLFRN